MDLGFRVYGLGFGFGVWGTPGQPGRDQNESFRASGHVAQRRLDSDGILHRLNQSFAAYWLARRAAQASAVAKARSASCINCDLIGMKPGTEDIALGRVQLALGSVRLGLRLQLASEVALTSITLQAKTRCNCMSDEEMVP